MGTEAFWIPAAIGAVGAGAEVVNQRNANSRQDAATAQGIMNQQALQSEAAGKAGQLTRAIARSNPNDIQGKATGEYVAQLRRNAAGSSRPGSGSALAPVVGGSSRYNADRTAAQTDVANYGNTQASQLGAIDSAVRQRQNESGGMQDLQTALNGVGARSQTQAFLDQLRASVAGRSNPWVSLGSKLLMNGAAAYAGAGAGSAASKGAGSGALLGDGTISGGVNSLDYSRIAAPQLFTTAL